MCAKKIIDPQFNQFDFGWIGNLKHYGKLDPPAYDLGRMTAPVFIFYGPNDYLSLPKVCDDVLIDYYNYLPTTNLNFCFLK